MVLLIKIFKSKTFRATVALIVLLVSLTISNPSLKINADSCPEGYTDKQCLDYLRDLTEQLNKEKSSLKSDLKEIQYEKLSLYEKRKYIDNEIKIREKSIKSLQLEIEEKNLNIKLIGEDITKIQDSIDVITQEINHMEEDISSQIELSYKYSKITPLEIFLSADNFETILRKSKYLLEVQEQSQDVIYALADKKSELSTKELELATKQNEVVQSRDEINQKKNSLASERSLLDQQRTEQNKLIAESEKLEKAYKAELASLQAEQSRINEQETKLVMKMFNEGKLANGTRVKQGDIIAYQGHTGCSYGSHLHLAIFTDFNNRTGTSKDPLSGYLSYSPDNHVRSGSMQAPLRNGYLTQNYKSSHLAIDLFSLTDGNQEWKTYGNCWENPTTNQCYYIKKGELTCNRNHSGWHSLRGEGAKIYALADGVVVYGVSPTYKNKYALVKHDNGLYSYYLHIK